MKLKFFAIPALSPEKEEAELNRFLDSHRVSQVERHLVTDGPTSFWSVCVTWLTGDVAEGKETVRRNRIDYREVLEADEFALYDRLRTLRKQMAEAEGLPPFAVFTNEQLADMVRKRITTAQQLAALEGIGDSRMGRFGEAFLKVLGEGVPRLGTPLGAETD